AGQRPGLGNRSRSRAAPDCKGGSRATLADRGPRRTCHRSSLPRLPRPPAGQQETSMVGPHVRPARAPRLVRKAPAPPTRSAAETTCPAASELDAACGSRQASRERTGRGARTMGIPAGESSLLDSNYLVRSKERDQSLSAVSG